jgi:hypothetical protein
VWLGALLTVSFAPAAALPPTGVSDKLEHALAYAALTLWFEPLTGRRGAAGLALAALGAAIEVLQPIVSDRLFERADIAANALGAGVGLALARTALGRWTNWFVRSLRSPPPRRPGLPRGGSSGDPGRIDQRLG